jgi:hypothetical protein
MRCEPVPSAAPMRGLAEIPSYVRAIAVALILSVIPVPAIIAQDSRTLTASEPDQGLTAIEIEGHVGKMQILPSTSAGIGVRVEVKRSISNGRARGNPQNVDLRSNRRGSTLVVSLAGDNKDLEEAWTLEIPPHLPVEAKLGVGDMDVSGMRGGIKAKVGVGALKIDVPEGDINAESGVGRVTVKSATNSYGNVDLRANVGSGVVRIDGRRIRQQNRPPGPSEHIALSGSGRDQFQIRSGVGDVELSIGR